MKISRSNDVPILVESFKFDFLDSEGKSLWNCYAKYKNHHDLMKDFKIRLKIKMNESHKKL
ncbi:hypothetical protein LCGC14_1886130 [marine sediment metagenome]|uniref:Uncharacterized protein n=1 Tax=marine sediment metagenome TaxID=412755 RepID=A0A0F9G0W8_9ZZZZ